MPKSLQYLALLWKQTGQSIRQRPWFHVGVLLILLLAVPLMMPHDPAWLQWIQRDPNLSPGVHEFAAKVSLYTEFLFTPILYCAVIWSVGWLRHKPALKRAALICVLASTTGGILVNVLRPTFGRPRPRAEMQDGFYWLEHRSHMWGFPSGHVMANLSGAVALTVVQPWLGTPYIFISATSGWSRMQRNAHYPADVAAAALLSISLGIAFARGSRLIAPQADPLETRPAPPSNASDQS
jgi:undecaprenyl-diphosphatase